MSQLSGKCLLFYILLSSCALPKGKRAEKTSDDSAPKYILYENIGKNRLIWQVFAPIKIHVVGDYEGTLSSEKLVKMAVNVWLSPLRSISNKPITREILVGHYPDDYQLKVNLVNACGRPFALENEISLFTKGFVNSPVPDANAENCPKMNNYKVFFHELGHVFGLKDTYSGLGEACLPDQPDSVMCSYQALLTADDKAGIIASFCTIYPENCEN